jgi:hypothetical protein
MSDVAKRYYWDAETQVYIDRNGEQCMCPAVVYDGDYMAILGERDAAVRRAEEAGSALTAERTRREALGARIAELEAERAWLREGVREWAAYCRVPMNCPNIADSMESAIGDPWHDYTSDGEEK